MTDRSTPRPDLRRAEARRGRQRRGWLTNVGYAGLALGWAWFAVSSIAFGGRLLRFAKPVETAEVAESVDPTPAPEPLVGHSS